MQNNPEKQDGDTILPSVQASKAQIPTARLVDTSAARLKESDGAAPNGLRLAIALFFGGLLRPRKAARNTSHIPLPAAFAIHAGFAFLITAVVLVMFSWEMKLGETEATHSDTQATLLLGCGLFDANTFLDFLQAYFIPFLLNLAMSEVALVAFAFALSSWGAREEPLRITLVNALRQTWLHTPSAFYIVVAIAVLAFTIDWGFRWDIWKLPNLLPFAWTDGTEFLEELSWLSRKYSDTDNANMPWFETHSTILGMTAFALALGWLFTTLLARIGARPVDEACERPPRCEKCGYIIYGIEVDGRCPECGASVQSVLGPNTRPGVPWQSTLGLPRVIAWFSTALSQLIRPASFGKRIRRMSGNFRHRTYALISVLLVAVCASVGLLYYDNTIHLFELEQCGTFSRLYPLNHVQMAFSCLLSLISASILAMIALTSCASIVGGWIYLRHGESATAAAIQAACYASWLLPLACITPIFIAAGIVTQSPLVAKIGELCSVATTDYGAAFVTIPVVAILLLMTFIVARTTGAMRYAHK